VGNRRVGRAATCTNLSQKSIHIFGISGPNYIGPEEKLAENRKNKNFVINLFSLQESPY
jgi:hypothetical protein